MTTSRKYFENNTMFYKNWILHKHVWLILYMYIVLQEQKHSG